MLSDESLSHWYHEGASKVISDADEAKLSDLEKSMSLMQNAVANGKRDLEESNRAAERLKELEAVSGEIHDVAKLQSEFDELTEKRKAWRVDAEKYRDMAEAAVSHKSTAKKAQSLHADILAWVAIADALSPDGIPGEMLAEALEPINERLAYSANEAQWLRINIGNDMSIFAAEEGAMPRHYYLLSESEKWRADAMIAEAVAHISEIKFLVLDRFDVLDLQGRSDLLYWLDRLARDGEIDTALIFGTLKALPAQLPETVAGFWIENGICGKKQEAA